MIPAPASRITDAVTGGSACCRRCAQRPGRGQWRSPRRRTSRTRSPAAVRVAAIPVRQDQRHAEQATSETEGRQEHHESGGAGHKTPGDAQPGKAQPAAGTVVVRIRMVVFVMVVVRVA